jgi:hypothetical protein
LRGQNVMNRKRARSTISGASGVCRALLRIPRQPQSTIRIGALSAFTSVGPAWTRA